MRLNHGSLFSGIGGFDYAAQQVGWNNIFAVEINKFCHTILAKHYPESNKYYDIKEFPAEEYQHKIDILTGGFPCQPFSSMGKMRGKEDERYLWKEYLRCIDAIQPEWVVGENVRRLTGFLEFEEICKDLEDRNYQVTPLLLPASALGARHRRERVYIVAHSPDKRRPEIMCHAPEYTTATLTDTPAMRVWESEAPPIASLCGMADGIPDRVHRIRALGNAIVPQCAILIFHTINKFYRNDTIL